MSSYLKRIGSTPEKFLISIDLHQLNINIAQNLACKVSIILKRGKNKVQAEIQPDLIKKQANFNEKLKIISTLYFDKKKKIYLSKKSQIDIILIFPNEIKLAGIVKINLDHYANYYKESKKINNFEYLTYLKVEISEIKFLDSCPDANATFSFDILVSDLKKTNSENYDLNNFSSLSSILNSKNEIEDDISIINQSKIIKNQNIEKQYNVKEYNNKEIYDFKFINSSEKEEINEIDENLKKNKIINSSEKEEINEIDKNLNKNKLKEKKILSFNKAFEFNKSSENKFSELSNKYEKLSADYTDVLNKTKTLEQISIDKDNFVKQNSFLLSEFNKMNKDHENNIKKIDELQFELNTKINLIKNLENQISSLKYSKFKDESEVSNLRNLLIQSEKEIRILENENNEIKNQLRNIEIGKINENNFEKERTDLNKKINASFLTIEKQKKLIIEHQKNEEILLAKQKEAVSNIKEKEEIIQKLNEKLDKIISENGNLNKSNEINEKLRAELTKVKNSLDNDKSETEKQKLLKALKEKENVVKEKDIFISQLEETNQEYKNKINELILESNSKQEKYEKEKKTDNLLKIRDSTNKLQKQDEIINNLQQDVINLETLKSSLLENNKQIIEEFDLLKEKYKLLNQENRKLSDFINSSNSENEKFFENTITLDNKIKEITKDRDNFKHLYNNVITRQKSLEEAISQSNIKLGKALNAAFESGATDLMDLIESAILSST